MGHPLPLRELHLSARSKAVHCYNQMYGLKPVPFEDMSFSATRKAHAVFGWRQQGLKPKVGLAGAARLKSCPDAKKGSAAPGQDFGQVRGSAG